MKIQTPLLLSLLAWPLLSACGPQPTQPGDTPSPTPTGEESPDSGSPTPTPEPSFGPEPSPTWELNTRFYMAGSFPQPGGMAVPGQLLAQVFFSEGWVGDPNLIDATLIGKSGKRVVLTNPELSPDERTVGWAAELWPEDFSYTLEVSVPENQYLDADWPMSLTAGFTSGVAPCTLTFDLYQGLEVVKLGGSFDPTDQYPPPEEDEAALEVINGWLADGAASYPTLLLLRGMSEGVEFPVEQLSAGLASAYDVGEDVVALYPDTGITSQLTQCNISTNGQLSCEQARGVLPVRLYPTFQSYLYMQDVLLTGQLRDSGQVKRLENVRLEAVVTGQDLNLFLSSMGYGALATQVEYDLDQDGDGLPDAARVILESAPRPVILDTCQP
ncbi:MAG: hypothetical protein ACKO6N_29690 [Myxococcota bacterium]